MSALPPHSNAALAPVRRALREVAGIQAAGLREGAARAADALLVSARAQAEKIIAEATLDGVAAARSEADRRSSRVRREAHEQVLARRSAMLAELHRQLGKRAAELRDDPRYPALLTGLTEQCMALLGPSARVDAVPAGGVVAEAGSRRLDLSLPVLAALALDSLVPEERALWTK